MENLLPRFKTFRLDEEDGDESQMNIGNETTGE